MLSKRGALLRVGNLLTVLGALLVVVPMLPAVMEEIKYLVIKPRVRAEAIVGSDWRIIIPKIGAEANVIADVDAFKESEYLEALKQGVAQAKGTAKPGEPGTIFLFAHSTDSILNLKNYNAVFYLLNKLEAGDEVWIDYLGKRYKYRVSGKEVVSAGDGQYLNMLGGGEGKGEKSTQPTGEVNQELVLQTCWPPGTTWKRLLVRAELVDII